MADNYHFDINGRERDAFERAMRFAFQEHATATHYVAHQHPAVNDGVARLVLFWSDPEGSVDATYAIAGHVAPLPYPMTLESITAFVWGWLHQLEDEYYPKRSPIWTDVHYAKGWRVYNDTWAQVEGYGGYSFAAIEPIRMMYGK